MNIGVKSLTGEGDRGHVFWDTEILMLAFFIYARPGTARSLLRYRHHTLPGAREVAPRQRLPSPSQIRHRDAMFCLHAPVAATAELVVAGQSLTLAADEPATVSLAGSEPALTP